MSRLPGTELEAFQTVSLHFVQIVCCTQSMLSRPLRDALEQSPPPLYEQVCTPCVLICKALVRSGPHAIRLFAFHCVSTHLRIQKLLLKVTQLSVPQPALGTHRAVIMSGMYGSEVGCLSNCPCCRCVQLPRLQHDVYEPPLVPQLWAHMQQRFCLSCRCHR